MYFHGRNKNRPYYGRHIFITESMSHASLYAANGDVYEVSLLFSEDKIFSITNLNHYEILKENFEDFILNKINQNEELDWAQISYFSKDPHDSMEEWLISLGFKAIKLKERSNVDSIYVFDQQDVVLESKTTSS